MKNQWPEDEDIMEISPEDFEELEEAPLVERFIEEEEDYDAPYLQQEEEPEELDFNRDPHEGWR